MAYYEATIYCGWVRVKKTTLYLHMWIWPTDKEMYIWETSAKSHSTPTEIGCWWSNLQQKHLELRKACLFVKDESDWGRRIGCEVRQSTQKRRIGCEVRQSTQKRRIGCEVRQNTQKRRIGCEVRQSTQNRTELFLASRQLESTCSAHKKIKLSPRWIPISGLTWWLYKCVALWMSVCGASATERYLGTIREEKGIYIRFLFLSCCKYYYDLSCWKLLKNTFFPSFLPKIKCPNFGIM